MIDMSFAIPHLNASVGIMLSTVISKNVICVTFWSRTELAMLKTPCKELNLVFLS